MVKNAHEGLEIYSEPGVRKILQSLRDGLINEIKPALGSEGFAYSEIEKITGLSRGEVKKVLEKLSETGVLLSEFAETRIACPFCGSPFLSVKLLCPNCGSPKLLRGEAIEHLPCGYIDFEEAFQSKEGLTCPKCRKPLKALGVDYRRPGKFYKCLSCGEFFGIPKKAFTCRSCGREFDEKKATLINSIIYRPNPEKREVILRESIDFKRIIEKLKKQGWLATHTAFLRGKSGLTYSFPLLVSARVNGVIEPRIIVQTLVGKQPIGADPVLSLFAKAEDVGVKEVALAVIPKLSFPARKLSEHFGFHVVEALDPRGLIESLSGALEKIVSQGQKPKA